MRTVRSWALAAAGVLALALALTPVATAHARVPGDFYGVVVQDSPTDADLAKMQKARVGTLRFMVWWRRIERAPGEYDWSSVDATVAGAAEHGIELLPYTYGTPEWLAAEGTDAPPGKRGRQAWGAFHSALVARYGRGGSFWEGHAETAPITRWQPGNEPNLRYFWGGKPDARRYAQLLKTASSSIHAGDPRATVVMAGLAPGRGALPWEFLRKLYRVPRIERSFDAVAFHPYARNLREVRYLLNRVRAAVRRAGDRRTPLEITELSWGSGGPPGYPLVRSPRGQAQMLRKAFHALANDRRRWRIRSIEWFSWEDSASPEPACLWCDHAGLFTLDREPKPAWRAFKKVATR